MSLGLDLSQVSENQTVPTGTYPVNVEKAEQVDTKMGGKMIKVQLKVLEGEQKGRFIFDQFNTQNSNPQATQIGLSQLKGLLKAFGHPNPNKLETTEELVGLKGLVRGVVQEDPGYGPQFRVKGYAPFAASGPVGDAAAPTGAKNPFA